MRRLIPVLAAGASGLLIAGGAFAYASVDKEVTLSVDGKQSTEQTYASTIGDFLAAKGISVRGTDVVAPGLDTKLADGTRVTVLYGRQVTVTVDGKPHTYWTTATNVDGALAGLDVKLDGAAISTSRSTSIGRSGITFDVATEKTVTLTNAGKKQTVKVTGRTVADVLRAAKVSVDANDKVTPGVRSRVFDGAKVDFVRVDVKTQTRTTDIAHPTRRAATSSLTRGTTQVDRKGRDGQRRTSYTLTYFNGKLVKTAKGSSKVTRPPVAEVVLVGTKAPVSKAPVTKVPVQRVPVQNVPKKKSPTTQAPTTQAPTTRVPENKVPERAQTSPGRSGSGTRARSVPSGSAWDRLAQCEAGGNWAINTGNGFYGGLQFTVSTWRGYGGTGMPHQASRETQIAIATKVQKAQGWGAWPACSSKLGLR